MAWKRLTYDDIRLFLAKDELDKLQNHSIDEEFTTVVQDTLDMAADAFRGAWTAKGYAVYQKDHYIDAGYRSFILAYARWMLWNRFPDAGAFALTETRKDEYEKALELLENPYIGVSKPDYSQDPDLSATQFGNEDAAISVPYLRFEPRPFDTGFPQAYFK